MATSRDGAVLNLQLDGSLIARYEHSFGFNAEGIAIDPDTSSLLLTNTTGIDAILG